MPIAAGRAPPYGAPPKPPPRPGGGPDIGAFLTAPYGLPLGRAADAGAGAFGFVLLMDRPSNETKPPNPSIIPEAGAGAGASKGDVAEAAGV